MAISVVEHLNGGGLVALPRCEEAPKLFSRLVLSGRTLRCLEALCPALRRDCCCEVGKLLRLNRQKLIAGLGRVKRLCGALACPDQTRPCAGMGVEVADDSRLNAQGVLRAVAGVLPACPGVRDQ